jgi:hypothetical protein
LQALEKLSVLYRAQKVAEAQDLAFKEEVKQPAKVDRLRPSSFVCKDRFAKAIAEVYGTACSAFKMVRYERKTV